MLSFINTFIAGAVAGGVIHHASKETDLELLTSALTQGDHFVGKAIIGTDDGRISGQAVMDTNTKFCGTDKFVVDASIRADLPTGLLRLLSWWWSLRKLVRRSWLCVDEIFTGKPGMFYLIEDIFPHIFKTG